jgi:hypothetical protein
LFLSIINYQLLQAPTMTFFFLTGNGGPKPADIKRFLHLLATLMVPPETIKEIQAMHLDVAWDKLRKMYIELQLQGFAIEDTSLSPIARDGTPCEVGSYIKSILDGLVKTGGNLYAVMKGFAPDGEDINYLYASTIGVRINGMMMLIECAMTCKLKPKDKDEVGAIDPYINPLSYTLTIHLEDGAKHVLKRDHPVSNPGGGSITSQPARREELHPRIHALKVLKVILEMGFDEFLAQFLDGRLAF